MRSASQATAAGARAGFLEALPVAPAALGTTCATSRCPCRAAKTSRRPDSQDDAAGVEVRTPPRLSQSLQPPSNHLCQSALSVPATKTSIRPGAQEATLRARREDPAEALPVAPSVVEPPVPERAVRPAREHVEPALLQEQHGGSEVRTPPRLSQPLHPFSNHLCQSALSVPRTKTSTRPSPHAAAAGDEVSTPPGSPNRSTRSRTTCARGRCPSRGRRRRASPLPGARARTRRQHALETLPTAPRHAHPSQRPLRVPTGSRAFPVRRRAAPSAGQRRAVLENQRVVSAACKRSPSFGSRSLTCRRRPEQLSSHRSRRLSRASSWRTSDTPTLLTQETHHWVEPRKAAV